MRVLTVRQPWAWAIVHGGKDVENRVRSLGPYRGPVAIHAGLRDATTAPTPLTTAWQVWWANEEANGRDPGGQRGHVIGVVDLVDAHQALTAECNDDPWANCSPWALWPIDVGADTLHHLVLANPRPLPRPVPATGRLGLWRPDDDLLTAITEQLRPGEVTA